MYSEGIKAGVLQVPLNNHEHVNISVSGTNATRNKNSPNSPNDRTCAQMCLIFAHFALPYGAEIYMVASVHVHSVRGVVWHIVRFLKSPQYLYFYLSFCVILPICCVCLSIFFNTADVHCTQDYKYEDESDAGQTSYLVLLGVFFAPLYIQLAVLVVAVIAVKVKLSHMEISNCIAF